MTCIHLSNTKGSLTRTVVFLILHLVTAWTIAFLLTGSVEIATYMSLLEPFFNAIWYFLLDKFLSSKCEHKS